MSIMSAEEQANNSLSDKDREMARRFGNEAQEPVIDDMELDDEDEETKTDAKDDRRALKRALFLKSVSEDEKHKHERTILERPRRNLFSGILKEDVAAPDTDKQKEQSPHNEQEIQHAFQDVVVDRITAVEKELEQSDGSQTTELLADASYLEDVGNRLEEGLPADVAIEDALEDQFIPPQIDATEQDLLDEEFYDPDNSTPAQQQNHTPTGQNLPVQPNVQTQPQQTINIPLHHRQSGSLGTRQPAPFLAPNPNFQTQQKNTSGNFAPQSGDVQHMNEFYYRRKKSRDMQIGGLIGYMIGRRGGRKRTEARLLPEIRKKDAVIGELKEKLISTEDRVRDLARQQQDQTEQYSDNAPNAVDAERKIDRTKTQDSVATPLQLEKVLEHIEQAKADTIEHERFVMSDIEKTFEETLKFEHKDEPLRFEHNVTRTVELEKQRALEQTPSLKPPEKYQQIDIRNEQKTTDTTEHVKNPRMMTVPELLEVADRIKLEKTSVKELYERNRVDAVNLRRIVQEYLQGGNTYEKVLRRSLEAVEMQRELRHEQRQDPAQRTAPGSQQQGTSGEDDRIGSNKTKNSKTNAFAGGSDSYGHENFIDTDDRIMISTGTAIALGILTGIAIMVLIYIFRR